MKPQQQKRKYTRRMPDTEAKSAMNWIKRNPQLTCAVLETFTKVKFNSRSTAN